MIAVFLVQIKFWRPWAKTCEYTHNCAGKAYVLGSFQPFGSVLVPKKLFVGLSFHNFGFKEGELNYFFFSYVPPNHNRLSMVRPLIIFNWTFETPCPTIWLAEKSRLQIFTLIGNYHSFREFWNNFYIFSTKALKCNSILLSRALISWCIGIVSV